MVVAGEMTHWSRAFPTHPQDPSLIASTHVGQFTTVCSSSPGSLVLLASAGACILTHKPLHKCTDTDLGIKRSLNIFFLKESDPREWLQDVLKHL